MTDSKSKFREFLESKMVKELNVGTLALFTVIGVLFYFEGYTQLFVTASVVLMFAYMLFFQTLWIYRDNKDHETPVSYAVGLEIANILVAIAISVLVFGIAIASELFFDIPFYLVIFPVVVIIFIFMVWQIIGDL